MNDSEGILIALLLVTGVMAIRYYTQKSRLQKEKLQLNKVLTEQQEAYQKLKSDSLRFQLTPHAFKNTLSNLKHYTQMADKAVNSVSDVLDYILYESNTDRVSLKQEVEFLNEFVELYSMRLNTLNAISFKNNISETHPLYSKPLLPPLVTAYFIENAFKHGDLDHQEGLTVVLGISGNEFYYVVSNKYNANKEIKTGGIGKTNIKERLDILCKGKYSLNYSNENGYYTATLKLNIAI
jgi:sensor histidine kinase YesM